MKIQRIKTSLLDMNEGQVAGLPTNPRQWTQTDIDRIAESLKETPELFEARPCIVYPHDGRYVILGGNLRYNGAQKNGDADVPCVVIPAETPLDTLKAIVIKDNGSFGAWDYDALGNEWDSLPLTDWGVPAWKTEEPEDEVKEKDVKDLSDNIDFQYKLEIQCVSEAEQEQMYNELTDRGFVCKILTL